MYLADYHTHSTHSPDAGASMPELARAAVAAGLQELCFTDHLEPIAWGTKEPRPPFDWAALQRDFEETCRLTGDAIQLRLGIELGDAPLDIAHVERLMADAPDLDFIIGSQHTLSEKYGCTDLYFFDPADEAEAYAGLEDYLDQVLETARWGKFSVLGHLTLPLRYLNENRGFQLRFDHYRDRIQQILQTVIEQGKGIELNTNRGNTPLPDAPWLRLYRELGGEIITLGSDAHTTGFVGCAIRERQQLLRECGFTRFCTFEKLHPIWHSL